MIPEKMYRYRNVWGDYICVPQKPKSGSSDYTEYTLTPTIKKFCDEKPKKTGWYLYQLVEGDDFYPAYYFTTSRKWRYGRNDEAMIDPECWCEIILPKEDV